MSFDDLQMIEKPFLAKSNVIEFRNFGHEQGIHVRKRNPWIITVKLYIEAKIIQSKAANLMQVFAVYLLSAKSFTCVYHISI